MAGAAGSDADAAVEGAEALVSVRLEPMVGRPVADDLLVLYRTVSIGEKAYRQGVVLEIPALVDWLAGRVLPPGSTGVTISRAAGSPSPPATGYAYRHRFAEPFAAVASVVTLAPLADERGASYLYTLAALAALLATAGLYAVYRMVRVVVSYAERRQNFVAAVTHELKTPLTAIRMYGEMLRDGVVASEAKRQRYYETLTAEAERLGRLLNNVLELGRLERRDRPMSLVVGDVATVASEVVDVMAPHVAREGFALRLDAAAELPAVRFDRDALKQVLFNLIDNAVKYSRDSARKEVVVSCRRHGEGVALVVSDHGPGVASEHLKKIFEPFYRGESELTRTAKGTGIGLALVRGLVERMGGSVAGRNGEPDGFEVTVRLVAGAAAAS